MSWLMVGFILETLTDALIIKSHKMLIVSLVKLTQNQKALTEYIYIVVFSTHEA